ncbi:MAG: glutathione S-transferase N-terminal domain-containing protein [bacterium]
MKVRRAVRKLKADVAYKNILWPPNIRRLVRDGGMYQIPCLFIDGKPMYESDDIVRFLESRFQSGQGA